MNATPDDLHVGLILLTILFTTTLPFIAVGSGLARLQDRRDAMLAARAPQPCHDFSHVHVLTEDEMLLMQVNEWRDTVGEENDYRALDRMREQEEREEALDRGEGL